MARDSNSRMRSSAVVWVALTGAGCGSVSAKQPDAGVSDDVMQVQEDAPRVAACGDGIRDPGEVCYGQAFVHVGSDVTKDGQLVDEDGDGDLDLVYLIGDQYKVVPQQGGQFAGTAVDGPTTYGDFFRAIDLGGSTRLELIDAGFESMSTWRRNTANTGYELINTATAVANAELRAFGAGKVMGGALPNLVGIYGLTIYLGTYNGSLQLSLANAGSVQGTVSSLDIGPLDADTLEDVVIAGTNGVVVYRGMSSGSLNSATATPQTAATDYVVVGDIDNDNINDLAFAVAGTSGQVGTMRGVGGAAFLGAATKTVANLGKPLDVADIDGDGYTDVIAARAQTGAHALLVLLGKADGTLADPVALPVAAPIDYIHCDADYNGDSTPDCVTTDWSGQNVIVLPSNP